MLTVGFWLSQAKGTRRIRVLKKRKWGRAILSAISMEKHWFRLGGLAIALRRGYWESVSEMKRSGWSFGQAPGFAAIGCGHTPTPRDL